LFRFDDVCYSADPVIDTQSEMDNENEEANPEEGGSIRSSEVLDQVCAVISDDHLTKRA
jgi:hypothetical protein